MSDPLTQCDDIQLRSAFEVSIVSVNEAELHVPSPVRDNAFWNQLKPLRFTAYRIKEKADDGVFYIPIPFRTEANLTILHFRVPYEVARRYLDENAERLAHTKNPPLLKVVEKDKEWAAGALWLMEYTKTDLGRQGNSQAGDYSEVVLTFTATDLGRQEGIVYGGRYTVASVLANSDFPSITAKLLLNNRVAIVAGRVAVGLDKHAGKIDVTKTEREALRFVARLSDDRQLFAIEIPKVGTWESLSNNIKLAGQTIRLFGLRTALSAAAKMTLRMIPGMRDLLTADRYDWYATLDSQFDDMPRRGRMDSDMNPWSIKLGMLNSRNITDGIDVQDTMFGALLRQAEFETVLTAQFRGAFGPTESGVEWLRRSVGAPTQER